LTVATLQLGFTDLRNCDMNSKLTSRVRVVQQAASPVKSAAKGACLDASKAIAGEMPSDPDDFPYYLKDFHNIDL
jgi:hypothetical protein